MKYKIAAISGVVLVLALAFVAWEQREVVGLSQLGLVEKSDGESAGAILRNPETRNSNISSSSSVEEPQVSANLPEVDLYSLRERFRVDYDPMVILAFGEFSDAEIAAYNELHIRPFNKEVGENCWEEQSEFLENGFVTVCDPIRERPAHSYESLEMDELSTLAEYDSVAAIIYAERTTDATERLKYYLHASALSGKSGPLIALAEKRYGHYISVEKVDGTYEQTLLPENLVRRLALEILAKKMGDPRARPELWASLINSLNIRNTEDMVKHAASLSNEWSKDMHTQQPAEVSGRLGENLDA
jgi:hypothetical protein